MSLMCAEVFGAALWAGVFGAAPLCAGGSASGHRPHSQGIQFAILRGNKMTTQINCVHKTINVRKIENYWAHLVACQYATKHMHLS